MEEIQIILPACSDDDVSEGLRLLTERLYAKGAETSGGVLGGEFGYGAWFENATFVMFPYYWGDCTCGFIEQCSQWDKENEHGSGCYQSLVHGSLVARGFVGDTVWAAAPKGMDYDEANRIRNEVYQKWCSHFGLKYPDGCAGHCTCDYRPNWEAWVKSRGHTDECPTEKPNFKHKPSGYTVRWYKYIGRDMEIEGDANFATVLADCLKSIAN